MRLLLLGICFIFSVSAVAGKDENTVTVSDAFIAPTEEGEFAAFGGARFTNASNKPVKLERIESPHFGQVMIINTFLRGGEKNTAQLPSIIIEPKRRFWVNGTGYQLVFNDPLHQLRNGDKMKTTFFFSNGDEVRVSIPVVYNQPITFKRAGE